MVVFELIFFLVTFGRLAVLAMAAARFLFAQVYVEKSGGWLLL